MNTTNNKKNRTDRTFYAAVADMTNENAESVTLNSITFKRCLTTTATTFDNIGAFLKAWAGQGLNDTNTVHTLFFPNLVEVADTLLAYFIEHGIKYDNQIGLEFYELRFYVNDYRFEIKDFKKVFDGDVNAMRETFKLSGSDIDVFCKAVEEYFVAGKYVRFTNASQALYEFKQIMKQQGYAFDSYFPQLADDIDSLCREVDKSGWNYVVPKYVDKDIKSEINVFDINSMYAFIQKSAVLPYGKPVEINTTWPKAPLESQVSFVSFECEFELKEGFFPFAKTVNSMYSDGHLTYETKGRSAFCMTWTEYQLFLKSYDVVDFVFLKQVTFAGARGLFDTYVNKYYAEKQEASTPFSRQHAKAMLVSLYGKFGAKTRLTNRDPRIDENTGRVVYEKGRDTFVKAIYAPMTAAIASIARTYIVSVALMHRDNFVYSDTDAVHLTTKNVKFEVDSKKLGAFGLEVTGTRFKYIRQKCYAIQKTDGSLHVKVAGMTDAVKKQVTFDNFKVGQKFDGLKKMIGRRGGMSIVTTTFEIKAIDDFDY